MKPCFLDLCWNLELVDQMLHAIADLAEVSYFIAYAMFIGKPVTRVDAEKVLVILSQYVGKSLTLESVDVPVVASEVKGNKSQSEVARLKAEIVLEYEACQQGLYGLSEGTARHVFITKRTENVARLVGQLSALVGEKRIDCT